MEMLEAKCENCNKRLIVDEEYMREQMSCTLYCMDMFDRKGKDLDIKFEILE